MMMNGLIRIGYSSINFHGVQTVEKAKAKPYSKLLWLICKSQLLLSFRVVIWGGGSIVLSG